jgi:hypothetical protein
MSIDARCPQCVFVSRQLGQPTPCLLHVSVVFEAEAQPPVPAEMLPPVVEDYDEPYAYGQLRLSVDRPGLFTLREYVRLQLLRTRIHASPSRLDAVAPVTRARTPSGR